MNNYLTPILLIIFNRIDTTKIVFDEIRKIKPKFLYLAADGYREDRTGEKEKCSNVKKWVLSNIDWDCEVKTLFRDKNLGCGKAVYEAISWFFEQEEEGIILEDDCVPHPDFFNYCSLLLERYRHDERVAVIGGDNFNADKKYGNASYYFSKYSFTWGWASWRRALKSYQFELKNLDQNKLLKKLDTTFKKRVEQHYWKNVFFHKLVDNDDTWDYQLWFHVWYHEMNSIVPNVNLVKNVGFNDNATHTTDSNSGQAFLETFPIMPLIHPKKIKIQHRADSIYFEKYWNPISRSFKTKLVAGIYRCTPHSVIELYRKIKRSFQ